MNAPDQSSDERHVPRYDELSRLGDDALMEHLRAGHPDALAVLFDRYHRLVLSIALRILRDAGEAEDLMQSVFLEIFRTAAKFDAAKGSTKMWILQFAYHRSFNRREYLNLRGIYEPAEEARENEKAPVQPGAQGLGILESARLVQQALSRLNKAQRRALELAFYEGLTMREIAQRTNESFDSVRHHYYRGLEKLRLFLCKEEGSNRAPSGGEVRNVKP